MIRHHVAVTCVLATIVWASLGVARFPQAGLVPATTMVAATPHLPTLRPVAIVGIGALCGMAAIGFGRARRLRNGA